MKHFLLLFLWGTVTFPSCDPLPNKPTPEAAVVSTVQWAVSETTISQRAFSINLSIWPDVESKNYIKNPQYVSTINAWNPGMVRLHNAKITRNPSTTTMSLVDSTTKGWNYTKLGPILDILKDIKAEKMMSIPEFPPWMDLNGDSVLDAGQADAYAQLCADLVKYINITHGQCYIKNWIVTNERDDLYNLQGRIPELVALTRKCIMAMKAVDPSILTGGPSFKRPDLTSVAFPYIDDLIDVLDFVDGHGYAVGNLAATDEAIYDRVVPMTSQMRALKDYVVNTKHKNIPVYFDEFNIQWSSSLNDGRMRNHIGAVFDALGYLETIEQGLDGLFPWNEMDNTYGKMTTTHLVNPGGHLLRLLNTHMIGTKVRTTTNTSAVKLLAVRSGNKSSFMLVNRTNSPVVVPTSFTGWVTEPARSTPFTQDQISSAGVVEGTFVTYENIVEGLNLPANSVTFLTTPNL